MFPRLCVRLREFGHLNNCHIYPSCKHQVLSIKDFPMSIFWELGAIEENVSCNSLVYFGAILILSKLFSYRDNQLLHFEMAIILKQE